MFYLYLLFIYLFLFFFSLGGPHGVTPNLFSMYAAFIACCGISVLTPNYRGSTAFGEAMLQSLPSRCGDRDVKDCIRALELILSRTGEQSIANRDNVHVQGGSHGGFLTTHLIGLE
jgi:acylaminoacyl-peptidase